MATLSMVKGGNVGRVNDIAEQIRNTCLAITEPHREMLGHKDAAKELNGTLNNERLRIAQEIADLSTKGKWTESDIKEATKRAAKGGNDTKGKKDRTDKTLATFISEVKLFAAPKIRGQAKDIIAFCAEAWEAENVQLADPDTEASELPVHKFTKRLYHLTMSVTRAVNKGVTVHSAEDVSEWCKLNDPDLDHEKIAKRLENVIDLLNDIVRDFGNQDVAQAAEFLGLVTADDLRNSRAVMHEGNTTVVTDETKPEVAQVAEGAVDLLNDIMPEAAD